jgi:hypothetical protein
MPNRCEETEDENENAATDGYLQGLTASGLQHAMNSKKHQSLSGEPAKISRKVGGKFTAWGSHISGFNLVLKP